MKTFHSETLKFHQSRGFEFMIMKLLQSHVALQNAKKGPQVTYRIFPFRYYENLFSLPSQGTALSLQAELQTVVELCVGRKDGRE